MTIKYVLWSKNIHGYILTQKPHLPDEAGEAQVIADFSIHTVLINWSE